MESNAFPCGIRCAPECGNGNSRVFTRFVIKRARSWRFLYAQRHVGNPLFSSDARNSNRGTAAWDFCRALDRFLSRRSQKRDNTFGMARTEILCARCGGHLPKAHVFDDGPQPTGTQKYCMNLSVALAFDKRWGICHSRESRNPDVCVSMPVSFFECFGFPRSPGMTCSIYYQIQN